jgi:Protein of unknown function (DUF3303)
MLFMAIERFTAGSLDAIGRRVRERGRMLPDGVTYHASWLEPDGSRCFQLMEAADAASLQPWMDAWADLVHIEVAPVVTSAEFWSQRDLTAGHRES